MKNQPPARLRPALLKRLVSGALAGLLAGVGMLAFMAFLRLCFHVATPTEMIFDRAFPFLTVKFFIGALVRAGGYSQLKLQGVFGALAGQLAAAGIGGIVYALFVDGLGGPKLPGERRPWLDPRGWRFIVPGVLGVWALFVGLLWPQLLTNYRGHPPAAASVVTAAAMLASFGFCGVAIMCFYGLLTVATPDAGTPREPSTAGLARRRFLAGGIGALAAVALGGMLRRLYQLGTFNYDGTQYGGPGVQKITPNDQFYQVTKNLVDPDVARDIWRSLAFRGLSPSKSGSSNRKLFGRFVGNRRGVPTWFAPTMPLNLARVSEKPFGSRKLASHKSLW